MSRKIVQPPRPHNAPRLNGRVISSARRLYPPVSFKLSQRLCTAISSHFDSGHCPFNACSPGFSRVSRGDRLKPGLHTCQNEQTKREARVAGPMNCVAVPEVARQEAMFTTRYGKIDRRKFIGRTAGGRLWLGPV